MRAQAVVASADTRAAEISDKMHGELFATLLIFLRSANRKVVQRKLGYVKLIVNAVPLPFLRTRFGTLVLVLLRWSRLGKVMFEASLRHTLEPLVCRFGYSSIYAAPADDEASCKVLLDVRKSQERDKRKHVAVAARDKDAGDTRRDKIAPAGDGRAAW
jgi:ribosomal RNA-processing protein 12